MTVSALPQAGSPTVSRALISAYSRAGDKLADASFVLVSGVRFVRLSDNAGTITIAAEYQSSASEARSNLNNSAQGASLIGVANQGLNRISALLGNGQTLIAAAQSGRYSAQQLATIDAMLADMFTQIDATVLQTTFNHQPLLDGSVNRTFVVSASSTGNSTITLSISAANTARLFPGGALSVQTPALATSSASALTNAQHLLQQTMADAGAYAQRFDAASSTAADTLGALNGARDNLLDAALPATQNQQAIDLIRHQAAAALIAQGGNVSSNLLTLLK